ncbi:MAG: hypothetical protein NTY64_15885 [Deltaproteobacteria bacterium]|nr:hypothetical protein [Deltaproteobacteria bacterium]
MGKEKKRGGFDRVGESPHFRLMLNGHIDHAEAGSMKNAHSGKIVLRDG